MLNLWLFGIESFHCILKDGVRSGRFNIQGVGIEPLYMVGLCVSVQMELKYMYGFISGGVMSRYYVAMFVVVVCLLLLLLFLHWTRVIM